MLGTDKIIKAIKLMFLNVILFTPFFALAQTSDGIITQKDAVYGSEGIDVLFTHATDFSLIAHTSGAGISFRYGKYLTAKTSRSLTADFLYFKHPKEEKAQNPVYLDGLPYVYGKVNSFMTLRVSVEHRKEITPKLRSGAVQVGRLARCGASLGLIKPIYLIIGYPEIPYERLETERYDPLSHFYDDIFGRAPWVNGVDEISISPGFHMSYGLFFEYGNIRGVTKSFEVGCSGDVFLSPVDIIATDFVDPNRFFLSLYVKIGLGSNWTQSE
tara:strand:+ start:580 stop:1392 length:813 start_codon:yes stop_codon:yes gene_type:complete